MAIIANLDVLLGARTRSFDAKMTASQARVTALGTAARAAAGGLAFLGATGAAFVLFRGIKNSLSNIDRLAKLAGNLGSTVKELQVLELQGRLTGVSSEKLGKALQTFNARLGETTFKTSEAKDALEALGVSADEFIGLPLEEKMAKVAEGLDGMSNERRAGILRALFGRTGADLINFFNGGAEGIRRASQFLDEFGLKIDDIGARGVERANDAWLRTSLILEGIVNKLTIQMAPVLEQTLWTTQRMAKVWQGIADSTDEAAQNQDKLNRLNKLGIFTSSLLRQAFEGKGAVNSINQALDELHKAELEFQQLRGRQRGDERARQAEGGGAEDGLTGINRLLNSPAIRRNTQEEFRILFGRTKEQSDAEKAAKQREDMKNKQDEANEHLGDINNKIGSLQVMGLIDSLV